LKENKIILQETRGWDDSKGKTLGQRSKEEANDYRYFPEPDIPPIEPERDGGIDIEKIKNWLPELPKEKRIRFEAEYSLLRQDAETLTSDLDLARFFEQVVEEMPEVAENTEIKKQKAKKIANWLISELLAKLNMHNISITDCKIDHKNLAILIEKIDAGEVSGKIAKEIFSEMFTSGKEVEIIIKEKGLSQINDSKEILTVIKAVIDENKTSVQDYKAGKKQVLGYLIGQVMAKTKGQANPQVVNKELKEVLGKE